MTITSETAQSGRVSHEVRRDGEDVRVKVSFAGGYAVGAYSITPEHARELAEALMEVVTAGEQRHRIIEAITGGALQLADAGIPEDVAMLAATGINSMLKRVGFGSEKIAKVIAPLVVAKRRGFAKREDVHQFCEHLPQFRANMGNIQVHEFRTIPVNDIIAMLVDEAGTLGRPGVAVVSV